MKKTQNWFSPAGIFRRTTGQPAYFLTYSPACYYTIPAAQFYG